MALVHLEFTSIRRMHSSARCNKITLGKVRRLITKQEKKQNRFENFPSLFFLPYFPHRLWTVLYIIPKYHLWELGKRKRNACT